jgi:DNA-binding NarL/FixJ family response regulator
MVTILVIDDEAELRSEIVDRLRWEGFTVYDADNGYKGVDLARTHLPNLIISDIMMPDMDGYEVLRTLRQDSSTLDIPFIFLSAKSDKFDIRTGMSQGADDYITKPFVFTDLLQSIRTRLERQQTREYQRAKMLSQQLIRITNKHVHQYVTRHLEQKSRAFRNQIHTWLTDLNTSLFDSAPRLQLADALMRQCDEFTHRTRIVVDLQLGAVPHVTDPDIPFNILRVVQEALDNVAAHTHETRVHVALWYEHETERQGGQLKGIVQDHGRGFALETALNNPNKFGLLTMRECIASIGGTIHIVSSAEHGTLISLAIPLEGETDIQHTHSTHNTVSITRAYDTLTEREREVFRYVAMGMTNAEIAALLVLSIRTVESHRLNLMRKLGVSNKADLLIYAVKNGLVSLS